MPNSTANILALADAFAKADQHFAFQRFTRPAGCETRVAAKDEMAHRICALWMAVGDGDVQRALDAGDVAKMLALDQVLHGVQALYDDVPLPINDADPFTRDAIKAVLVGARRLRAAEAASADPASDPADAPAEVDLPPEDEPVLPPEPPAGPAQGPQKDGHTFVWNPHTCRRLSQYRFKLLEVMWGGGERHLSLSYDVVYEAIWGDEACDEDKLVKLVRRTNDQLELNGIHIGLCCRNKRVVCSW